MQDIIVVSRKGKQAELEKILGDPVRDPAEKVLIFVQTKKMADFLATYLSDEGYPTTNIQGSCRGPAAIQRSCHGHAAIQRPHSHQAVPPPSGGHAAIRQSPCGHTAIKRPRRHQEAPASFGNQSGPHLDGQMD